MAKESKSEPEILNPRYRGATPEMVGRALLRPSNGEKEGDAEQASSNGKDEFQSSI